MQRLIWFVAVAGWLLNGYGASRPATVCGQDRASRDGAAHPSTSWQSLFDGKTLGDWKVSEFGGQDEVIVESGSIVVSAGYPLAGITYQGAFPTDNYEIALQARKRQGTDFFCCLTLPAGDEHFSFVVGGWGGAVTGISNVDQQDASDNATRSVRKYEVDRWYSIRVAVGDSKIKCWIDDQLVVDLNHADRKLTLRAEVVPSKPVGLCCFETRSEYRAIKLLKKSK